MYEYINLKTDVIPEQIEDSEYVDLMKIWDTGCQVYDKITNQAITIDTGGEPTLGRVWAPPGIDPIPLLYILAKEFLVEFANYSSYNRVYDNLEEGSLCFSFPVYLDYDYVYMSNTQSLIEWIESENAYGLFQLKLKPKISNNNSKSESGWFYHDQFYPSIPDKYFYGYDIPFEMASVDSFENLMDEVIFYQSLIK